MLNKRKGKRRPVDADASEASAGKYLNALQQRNAVLQAENKLLREMVDVLKGK